MELLWSEKSESEIRRGNQASCFCCFFFPFLLHVREERTTQTHMRYSGFEQRRQQEKCYYKALLHWQYYHLNPHMGFFCSPSKFSDTIRYSMLRHNASPENLKKDILAAMELPVSERYPCSFGFCLVLVLVLVISLPQVAACKEC